MPFSQTGPIWDVHPRKRSQIVRWVCEAFAREYGKPRFGNPTKPVDDLVFIVLSNKTSPSLAARTFRDLKKTFRSWDNLADASLAQIRRVLQPAGLGGVRSRQLRGALRRMRKDWGSCSLDHLRRLPADDAERCLTSLPGVSEKVAKCVMMYTLGFSVLPVDVHVHRIARRLGWTRRRRADQCHPELEALVKPEYRYVFHVGCIAHGRTVCRPVAPDCQICVLRPHCRYFRYERDEENGSTD